MVGTRKYGHGRLSTWTRTVSGKTLLIQKSRWIYLRSISPILHLELERFIPSKLFRSNEQRVSSFRLVKSIFLSLWGARKDMNVYCSHEKPQNGAGHCSPISERNILFLSFRLFEMTNQTAFLCEGIILGNPRRDREF